MVASLIVFFILSGIALSLGSQLLHLARYEFVDLEEEIVFSYGLGLLLLSELVLVLGVAGLLEKKFLLCGVGVLAAIGSLRIPHLVKLAMKREGAVSGPVPYRLEVIFWILILFIGWGALVPPHGTDALVYHLSSPLGFLRMKRLDLIPDDLNSLFPFFTETLFTLGLALRNETVAQLFHWSLGALLALAVASFFSRFFGSKKWGRIAAIFLLLTPGIFNEMRSALADVAWACYGFLSFYALLGALQEQNKRRLWLSFVFLGVTLGIKYLAALSFLATLCVFLVFTVRLRWKFSQIGRWLVGMGIAAFLVSGYWYLKVYLVHGNPFYPYFNSLFGLEPLRVGAHAPGEYAHKAGMGRSFWDLLLLPFRLTLFPTRFDGWAEQLGPAYLVFLPFAFLGAWSEARRSMGWYSLFYIGGWFWLAQVTRFFYPVLPFLVLLIISGIYLFYRSQKKKPVFLAPILALVFLLNGAILTYHTRDSFAYLLGLESKDAFLAKRERSYAVAKFVRENLPLNVKILNAEEVRMFYFDRHLVREGTYRFRTKYDRADRYDAVHERLKKDGFTHLLIVDFGSKGVKEGIHKWVGPDTQDPRLHLMSRSTFKERDGREVKYALFELK